MNKKILFIFSGEKSSGAEFVIETLIRNYDPTNSLLIMSPGSFYEKLAADPTLPYILQNFNGLRKLNTSRGGKLKSVRKFIVSILKINIYVLKQIKLFKPNIIHTNTIVPTFYLLPLFFLLKIYRRDIKFIWSDHDITYVHKIFNKTLPYIYKVYDKTIVVSKAVLDKYKQNDKVRILYNGLDPKNITINNELGREFRKKCGIPVDATIIGILGQIVERKGVNDLVKVVIELEKEFAQHNTYLVVGGLPESVDTEYYQLFTKLIKQSKHIIYIGYCDNISFFYNGIDIIINNSTKEGGEPLGTTIIEGLAYGKIVVASNVGGSPEIITDKIDGFLFNPDKESLYSIVTSLLYLNNNNDFILNLQSSARSKFMKKFQLQDMIYNYQQILNEL